MSVETSSIIGSGTTPLILSFPVPYQDPSGIPPKNVVYRHGQNAVIINLEDTAVWLGGYTKQLNVGGTAVRLDDGVEYRRAIAIKNASSTDDLVIGFSGTVTTTTGYILFPKESISLDAKNLLSVWGITGGTTVRTCVMELS